MLTFPDFIRQKPSAGFSDWLAHCSGDAWGKATDHAFTVAIGDGTVSEASYGAYLIEDYTFIGDLASTIGYLVAKAPAMPAKSRLSAFLAALTSEENDYFLRSFEALGVSPETYLNAEQGPVTRAFSELLMSSSRDKSYAEGLACLLCAEWVYLTWGQREAMKPRPDRFYLAEWIDLHAVSEFESFVKWLRAEMDAIGPELSADEQAAVARTFAKMCELEVAFFDAAEASAK